MHEQLYREIEGMQDRLAAWRRVLHQIPEVSMDLPNTLAYMKDRLNEMGVGYTQAGRCGLYALLGGENVCPDIHAALARAAELVAEPEK